MGMRAFVWFWVMVSFYGAFSCQLRAQVHLTLLSGLRKRGIWPTFEAVKGCVLVLVRGCLGRVGCVFGWLLGSMVVRCF